MIFIRRMPEPAELGSIRHGALAAMRQVVATRPPQRADFDTGYQRFRPRLRDMQHLKCCYCESEVFESFNDVEHFRPTSRYWWLAWTWENLLFACNRCNRTYKGDEFPRAAGSAVLQPEDPPPGQEEPLLIDPAAENPMAHIRFLPIGRYWWAFPRDGSPRGQKTIEVLGLNEDDLRDRHRRYVDEELASPIRGIQAALAGSLRGDVQRAWRREVPRLFYPSRRFLALTYDVLDHHFPRGMRDEFALVLPHPRALVASAPPPARPPI